MFSHHVFKDFFPHWYTKYEPFLYLFALLQFYHFLYLYCISIHKNKEKKIHIRLIDLIQWFDFSFVFFSRWIVKWIFLILHITSFVSGMINRNKVFYSLKFNFLSSSQKKKCFSQYDRRICEANGNIISIQLK